MSEPSLFLLQSHFADTAAALAKVHTLYGEGDHLLLMGEAVLFASHEAVQKLPNVAVLAIDAQMLSAPLPAHVHVLDESGFAELVLQFTRCITFK